MNTDIVLDSEHATTVESDAETMGMPRVVTSDAPKVPQVGAGVKATSNEIQFRVEHLAEEMSTLNSSEFKRASNSELQYLIELNQNSHTANSTATWLRRFNK